jgi:undecaprenyl-diphosphatase
MNLWQAVVLGIVEGLTEFLPVSSTGHLTVVEKLLGLDVADAGVTAFTAVIQVGAIIACVVYFWRDIVRLAAAWFRGLANRDARDHDYRLAWYVIVGSIPIGIVGFLGRHIISGSLRNLWVVVAAWIGWSIAMVLAERLGRQERGENDLTLRDGLIIGLVQCIALIPGVSRSGATISAGLALAIDRVTATRLSFFLAIPALLAAGGFEAATGAGDIANTVGWLPTIIATLVSLVVAYVSIAWLLRFVAHHRLTAFVGYRVAAAVLVAALLAFGVITAV